MKKSRIAVLALIALAAVGCLIALIKTAMETADRDAGMGVESTETAAPQTKEDNKEQIMSTDGDQDLIVETIPGYGTITRKRHSLFKPSEDSPEAYRAFWDALRREEALKKRALTLEEIRAIAQEHADGNADAETYFFLDAEWKLKEKPRRFIPSEKYRQLLEAKKNLYGLEDWEDADLVNIYLSDQYESDTENVLYQTKPIDDWAAWIRENAPAEWEIVGKAYSDNQWEFLGKEPEKWNGPLRYTYENFPTVEQRARAYYTAFFEAVALLPDDAAAFTVYFGSASPAPEEPKVEKATPPMKEAAPRQDAPPPPEERPTAPDEAADVEAAFEAAFEQAIQDSIRRHGPEEGLRRLIMSDQDWIERIARLQERRQGR